MVVEKARGIAAAIVAGVTAVGLAGPALAHPHEQPLLSQCEALAHQDVDLDFERDAIVVPETWSDFAAASQTWLAVKMTAGNTDCIDMGWVGEAREYEIFKDRFLGFEWIGYEAYGYTLIDRQGTGTILETGARPIFSPDGSMLAAIESSESGYGGLEGFAVWMVYDGGLVGQYLTKRLPVEMTDWRIDRWENDMCVHISALEFDKIGDNWDKLETLPRVDYVAGSAEGWAVKRGTTCPTYD